MAILSICIPTYKRPEILKQTLDSIYNQNVDVSFFNVYITDNSRTDETKEMIDNFFCDKINLFYKKTTCEGFLNSIEALKFGNDDFLKLHNDYSCFNNGSLKNIIEFLNSITDDKSSVVFFSEKKIKTTNSIECFNNFDSFLNCINYWSTWSTSFAIWKNELDRIYSPNIEVDNQFPHTSILFEQAYNSKFYVNNNQYFNNINVTSKRERNIIEHFITIYLGMIENLYNQKLISKETLENIKTNTLMFCGNVFIDAKYSKKTYFLFNQSFKRIFNRCGIKGVIKYWSHIVFRIFTLIIKKIGVR